MLDTIEVDIKQHYYDPQMHGLDLHARFESARQKIAAAQSQNEALLDVAGAVGSLNDSHTRFIPPAPPYGVYYGWRMQAVGDTSCYVTQVRPESEAASKGLKPGDQIISVNGVTLTRQNLNYVEYGYHVFPQSGLHLIVQSAEGTQRSIVAMAKVIPGQQIIRHSDFMTWWREHAQDLPKDRSRYHNDGNVLFWKLPDFLIDPTDLERALDRTRSFASVVLDLRGNPGGSESEVKRLLGGFFAHDVRIADRKSSGREGLRGQVDCPYRQQVQFGGGDIRSRGATRKTWDGFRRPL
jgi:C-terminal processing protease CtpA/Prc